MLKLQLYCVIWHMHFIPNGFKSSVIGTTDWLLLHFPVVSLNVRKNYR